MTSFHFDKDYLEEAKLKDGRRVALRCVRPEDKHLLVEGMHHLSEESIYRRFFTAKPSLSESELVFLTEVDGIDHFAMGAMTWHHGKEYGIGIARFIRLKNRPTVAEPAIVIIDEEQGKGLGQLLFLRLVAAAVERGIERFHCEILSTNDPVRFLLDEVPTPHDVERRGSEEIIEFPLPNINVYARDYNEPPEADPFRRIVKSMRSGKLRLKSGLLNIFNRDH